MSQVLALDIGGANIKAAWWEGDRVAACSVPFALWREPDLLAGRLAEVTQQVGSFKTCLVTMTGELCDCFTTKRAGVEHILTQVSQFAGSRSVLVWSLAGRLVTPVQVVKDGEPVAAGNWHAATTWLARQYIDALWIDTGSTTTDIIRLVNGRVDSNSPTDTDRLASGELVYIGASRTPLMAVTSQLHHLGREIGVMAEWFATMDDVALLTGRVTARPGDVNTCDGRAFTLDASAARVARMIGADIDTLSIDEAIQLARSFECAAVSRIAAGVRQVSQIDRAARVIVSGSGDWLAKAAVKAVCVEADVIDLKGVIGPQASSAVCAVALLHLYASDGGGNE